ncbi:MAG TPA: hypothetical protein VHG91_08035 [Longimicrobium sp.]|nr:hypothetical protein [Longimicrobium sp.]
MKLSIDALEVTTFQTVSNRYVAPIVSTDDVPFCNGGDVGTGSIIVYETIEFQTCTCDF